MINPALAAFEHMSNNNNNNNNSIFSLINQVRQSSNPQEAMNQIIASNPQFQNVMNYIAQNGGDAKTAFYNMAAQKNVDPNTILRSLR